MTMPLHKVRDKTDEALDDLFKDIDLNQVLHVVECHGSYDDDSIYVFLIWTKDYDDATVPAQLALNAQDVGATLQEAAPCLYLWAEDVTTPEV